MHGGNTCSVSTGGGVSGLSPRARGEHLYRSLCLPCYRTIPACTGGTCTKNRMSSSLWDYPRVHGGNNFSIHSLPLSPGLSPRARGELVDLATVANTDRTIPACTGGTFGLYARKLDYRDYPRVHGGNAQS